MSEIKQTDDEIQLEGFQDYWCRIIGACKSCLERNVLRNQKETLKEEWLKVRPMIDSKSYTRDEGGRVCQK